jgi:hypothetical protein
MSLNFTPADLDRLAAAVWNLEAQTQNLIEDYVRGEAQDLEQQALDLKTHTVNSLILKLAKEIAPSA